MIALFKKKRGKPIADEEIRVGSRYASLPKSFRSRWLHSYAVDLSAAPDASTLWHSASFENGSKESYTGLLNLISARGEPDHSVSAVGSYDGAYFVRPYTQFLFVTSENDDQTPLKRNLERYFEASVGDLTYEEPGFGFVRKRNARGSRLFFGAGAFLPKKGAQQIGRLEIKVADNPEWVAPKFVVDGAEAEAGFYPEQWALSVSTDVGMAPATIPGNVLATAGGAEFTLHFGSQMRQRQPVIALEEPGNAAEPALTFVEWDKLCSDEGQLVRHRSLELAVRYTRDVRPFRLETKVKGDTQLKFLGFVVPTWGFGHTTHAAACHVDFDENGYLVTVPLVPRKYTLQVSPGRLFRRRVNQSVHNWESGAKDTAFEDSFKLIPTEVPGAWDGHLLFLERQSAAGPLVNLANLKDGRFNATTLMDCASVLEVNGETRPWSYAFERADELRLERVNDRLQITCENSAASLDGRVFELEAGMTKASQVTGELQKFGSGTCLIIDGIIWQVHLS